MKSLGNVKEKEITKKYVNRGLDSFTDLGKTFHNPKYLKGVHVGQNISEKAWRHFWTTPKYKTRLLNRLFNNINKLSHHHNCPWQVERVRARALPLGLMFWSESQSHTLSDSLLLLFQCFQSSTIAGHPLDLTLIASEEHAGSETKNERHHDKNSSIRATEQHFATREELEALNQDSGQLVDLSSLAFGIIIKRTLEN